MKSILVVDDMAVFREPIAASLRLAGHDAFCAVNGEEALKITRKLRPDVILLDVSMPAMDGISFLRHLRLDPLIRDTPVILLTAISDKKHLNAATLLGVSEILLKSRFSLQDLLQRISRVDSHETVEREIQGFPEHNYKNCSNSPT